MVTKRAKDAKSTQWAKAQYARLDETRQLLDDAHARAGELLELARDFFTKMDATSVEFFERIVTEEEKKPKRDRSPLLGFAKSALGMYVRCLEAEKLAVALGCYVIARGKDRTVALRDLNKEFPDWQDKLSEWEESWDDDEDDSSK